MCSWVYDVWHRTSLRAQRGMEPEAMCHDPASCFASRLLMSVSLGPGRYTSENSLPRWTWKSCGNRWSFELFGFQLPQQLIWSLTFIRSKTKWVFQGIVLYSRCTSNVESVFKESMFCLLVLWKMISNMKMVSTYRESKTLWWCFGYGSEMQLSCWKE